MKGGQKQRPQRNEFGGQDCMTSNVMQYDSNRYSTSPVEQTVQYKKRFFHFSSSSFFFLQQLMRAPSSTAVLKLHLDKFV